MNRLALENLGVQELNANEMKENNGGIFPLLLAAYIVSDIACAALAVGIYNGYQDAKQADK